MDYEIIATLGPGSDDKALWPAMLQAGVTAFRLNTSHLSLDQLDAWMGRLEPFLAAQPARPPLVLDLQGSKWRLGQFEPFDMQEGQRVELVLGAASQQAGALPVPHADFFAAAPQSSGDLALNDAKIRLSLESAGEDRLWARVLRGGRISAHKGLTFTASTYRIEKLNEKDGQIIRLTAGLPGLRYALSYIKDAAEMQHYRTLLGEDLYLIAKLERQPAVDEAEQMAADELWLCRGDLGAELGLKGMAEAVHRLGRALPRIRPPVMMAGQVLEHMTDKPTPTRSEVCYLYDAIAGGYRGVVLSDEAAVGSYPLEACRAAALFQS